MHFLLLKGARNLSEQSPHVRKGSMGPKRINSDKLEPNHMHDFNENSQDGELVGEGCYDTTCRAQQFKPRRVKTRTEYNQIISEGSACLNKNCRISFSAQFLTSGRFSLLKKVIFAQKTADPVNKR